MKINLFDKKEMNSPLVRTISVEDLVKEVETKNCNVKIAFISSANSLLFMDGGSDLGYMKSIPNIQSICKKGAKLSGKVSDLGRPYLPIGDAMAFKVPDKNYYFISCPTMFLPQKVNETNNPFYALQAGLELCRYLDIEQVYCPMMCTNWGGMSFSQSLEQMTKASTTRVNNGEVKRLENYYYFTRSKEDLKKIIQEQPKVYCNTEFYVSLNFD